MMSSRSNVTGTLTLLEAAVIAGVNANLLHRLYQCFALRDFPPKQMTTAVP
jgi:hypothetical protein